MHHIYTFDVGQEDLLVLTHMNQILVLLLVYAVHTVDAVDAVDAAGVAGAEEDLGGPLGLGRPAWVDGQAHDGQAGTGFNLSRQQNLSLQLVQVPESQSWKLLECASRCFFF